MAKRPRGPLLVDAHNLIWQEPGLRRLILGEPERARRHLEARVAGIRGVHLFYDGGPGGRARNLGRRDYSGPGSADDRIVAWLQRHPQRPVTVVSDDRHLGERVRALGARLWPVARLLGLLSANERAPAPPSPQERELSAAEIAEWERRFGVADDD